MMSSRTPLDIAVQQLWLQGRTTATTSSTGGDLLTATNTDDSPTSSPFPAALDLVRLLVVDGDLSALVDLNSSDAISSQDTNDGGRRDSDTRLVWEFVEAEIAQMAHMRCVGDGDGGIAAGGYFGAAQQILSIVDVLLDASSINASGASAPLSQSKKGGGQKKRQATVSMEGLLRKALSDESIAKVLPRVIDDQPPSENCEGVSPAARNLSILLACFTEKSSSNWLRSLMLPRGMLAEQQASSATVGGGPAGWSPCGILAAILFESVRFAAQHHDTRPAMDAPPSPPHHHATTTSTNDGQREEPDKVEEVVTSSTNHTDKVESCLLGAFFLLIGRYSDRCLPWVDTNYIKLAHTAGGSDFMRLLLQYHDPELSLHLDQHPLPRPTLRAHKQGIAYIVRGVPLVPETADVPATTTVPPQQQPAESELLREAFTPRTFGEAACGFVCGMSPSTASTSATASVTAQLYRETLWSTVMYSRTVTCRPAAQSHHLPDGGEGPSTVRPGSSRNSHVPYVSTGECLFPVIAFVVSAIHRREEILALCEGDTLGEFWAEYHPFRSSTAITNSSDPVAKSAQQQKRFAFPPPLLFEPTTTNDADGSLNQDRVNDAEITRQAPSFHIELSELYRNDTCASPSTLRRALGVIASESVPRVIRNTPKSSLNLLRRDIVASDRCDYSTSALNHLREYLLGFAALPVTSNELAASFPNRDVPPGAIPPPRDPDQLRYIILDTRSENSFLYARLPTAIHMGSDVGFDRAMMRSSLRKVNPIRYSHLAVMGTGRPILEESNLLKFLTFSLLEGDTTTTTTAPTGGPAAAASSSSSPATSSAAVAAEFIGGLPYVSAIDGGFKSCVPYIKAGTMEYIKSPLPPSAANGADQAEEAKALFTEGRKVAAETFGTISSGVSGWFSRLSTTTAASSSIGSATAASATPQQQDPPVALTDRAKEVGGRATEGLSYAKSWGAGMWNSVASKVTTAPAVAGGGAAAATPPLTQQQQQQPPLTATVVTQPSKAFSSSSQQPQWGVTAATTPPVVASGVTAQSITTTSATAALAPAGSTPPPQPEDGRFWKFFAATSPSQQPVSATDATITASQDEDGRKLFDLGKKVKKDVGGEDDDDDDDLDLILTVGTTASTTRHEESESKVIAAVIPDAVPSNVAASEPADVTPVVEVPAESISEEVEEVSPAPTNPTPAVATPAPPTTTPPPKKAVPTTSASPHPFDDIFGDDF